MKESRVDLNQQRHHSKAQIVTGCHSQTEAREHLREEFEWSNHQRDKQHNIIHIFTLPNAYMHAQMAHEKSSVTNSNIRYN